MKINENKTLAFWGTGNIASICLKQFPNIRPNVFIDSNWETEEKFNGITVAKPQEIEDWNQYFIVIAVSYFAYDEIEAILIQKGLIKGQDYVGIDEFYGIGNKSIIDSLSSIDNYLQQNNNDEIFTVIFAPVFTSRTSDLMVKFFHLYGEKKTKGKCALFTSLYVKSEKEAADIIGFPVFDIPQICNWAGKHENGISADELIHGQELTKDEIAWIHSLEQKKICKNRKLAFKISMEIYWYCKRIFDVLNPKEVIIWGEWTRLSYILQKISESRNISYGFMEYGWIPGTFQFEHGGLAGQSEYAICPEKLLNMEVKSNITDIREIRKYIQKTGLDNGKFKENNDDEMSLNHVDKNKKTVFLVGMGDHEMCMNPESEYWNRYISSLVGSTWESVLYIADFCKKNDWNFIFKPHPSSIKNNGIKMNQFPDNVILIKDMKIDRLIKMSNIVVSIVSAVDYKVLVYGKPLISLGHTTLQGKNCCYEPQSTEDIEIQMRIAMKCGMTEEQNVNFEKHMAQLLENYLWDDLGERELRYGLTLERDFFD